MRHPASTTMLSSISVSRRQSRRARRCPSPQSPRGSTQTLGRSSAARLEILVVVEIAVALQQAEAARVGHLEAAGLMRRGLSSGRHSHSPLSKCSSRPSESCTSGRKSSKRSRRVLAEEEHAGQRRDAELSDGAAREQPRTRRRPSSASPGSHHEAVGAGDARPVEERVDRRARRVRRRAPPARTRGSTGTLRRARFAVFDRQPARRQAVDLLAPERAEVAGAEEDDDLVVVLRPSAAGSGCGSRRSRCPAESWLGKVVLAVVELRGRERRRADAGHPRRRSV